MSFHFFHEKDRAVSLQGLSSLFAMGSFKFSLSPKRREPYRFLCTALIKKGGDLLSHFRSTIGAEGLNFSVRNGKRWNTLAITTYIFSISSSLTLSFLFVS
jgi:hypothetical protein